MNSTGSSGASKDSDLDGEWLPDLDSSSGESDLESCESIYTQRLFLIATCLHCTSRVQIYTDRPDLLLVVSILYSEKLSRH